MAQKDIIQELNDLGSSLVNANLQNIYAIPEGYFEGFAAKVLSRIKAGDEITADISFLPKENPYRVPVGYFDGLEEKIMDAIRNHADHQNSQEELETLSPLLSSLNKKPVYSVPEDYFANFEVAIGNQKSKAKVIGITGRKWIRYAAAAVVTGIIVLAGFMIYNNNHKDAAGRTIAKFEKDVKKIEDVKQTQNLIDIMDAGLNEKELASVNKTIKTDDVQQLLQDVSVDELNDFNEQSKAIEDVMMTN